MTGSRAKLTAVFCLLATGGGVALATDGGPGSERETAADGSTLVSTWEDRDGDGELEVGPGEQMTERTDLAAPSELTDEIATLVQVSDAHVRDEESPARAVLLDRLSPLLSEAARPQEPLSTQVFAAALRSADEVGADAVLETGDLIDSAQDNELDQALSVLEGGQVDPDSGGPGYDGLQELSNADPFIYRPDLDSPRHLGLLGDAQEPFSSPGLDVPWFPVLGNHDLLVQGEVPPTPTLESIATGSRELVALDPDLEAPEGVTSLTPELVEQFLGRGLPGRTEQVPADAARRHLSEGEVLARLRDESGVGGSGPRLDYTANVGARLRLIVLDAVSREGGAAGAIEDEQLGWLRKQLDRAGERWVVVATHQPLAASEGGAAALEILDREPRVIAALSGHTHEASIEPRPTDAGGYWLISSPSLADFPQQSRALSIAETDDGVAIETWMLDTAPDELADTARELAYLDAGGGRPDGNAGEASDRNARLYLSR